VDAPLPTISEEHVLAVPEVLPHPSTPCTPHDFTDVYRQHAQRISKYCLRRLRNEADAQDATQETFARASQQLGRISGDIGAYLTAIARNVCYDLRRHNRTPCLPIEDLDRADPRHGPEHRALDRSLVDRTWVGLTSHEKGLLALTYAGFTYQEISGITGKSAKAVSVAITRARQRARQLATGAASVGLALGGLIRRLLSRNEHVSAAMATTEQMALLAMSIAAGVGVTTTATPSTASGNGTTASITAAVPRASGTAPAARLAMPGHSGGVLFISPAPAATPASAPAAKPGGPLLDRSTPAPQDVAFSSFTSSPQYSQDRTVFASGYRLGCSAQCSVIFRSRDAGATWSFVGFDSGGPVLLPAAYPADPTIYVASSSGLERSDDGGVSFHLAAPIVGPAAVLPGGAPGSARILLTASQTPQTWVYSEASRTLSPGPALPAGLLPDSVVAVNADDFVVAAHNVAVNAPALGRTYFVDCTVTGCTTSASFDGYAPSVQMVISSGQETARTIAAFAGASLFLSRDAGKSFEPASTGLSGTIAAVSLFGGQAMPGLLVAANTSSGASETSALALSADGGMTYARLPAFSGPTLVAAMAGLPDGRLVGYLDAGGADGATGLRCSTDSGRTWTLSC